MTLSIIVPIYNSEKTIKRCLDSILSQSFSDFELILINDCSIDRSRSICEEYAILDRRVRVYHNESNRGVSYSRNFAINKASGKWLMFVDSDDWLDDNYISDILPAVNVDLVISSFVYYGKDIIKVPIRSTIYGYEQIGLYLNDYCTRFTSPWAKVYKTSIIKSHHLRFDENICHGEDTIFLFDYILNVYSIETREIYGYCYSCDIANSLSKKSKSLSQYLDIIYALNERLKKLETQYSWSSQNARLELTEYFLSRCIRQLLNDDISFKRRIEELKTLLTSVYVEDVMSDTKYIIKGRKRKVFDWFAIHRFYGVAVLLLFIYKRMGLTI